MKNNKIMRAIIGMTLLLALFIPVTALASPNYDFEFTFTNLKNKVTGTYQKGDPEQNWYVSLDNNGKNTLSSSNLLGLRMNRNGKYISEYFLFDYYDRSICRPYYESITVSSDDWVYMGAKKDSTSTSSAALVISGRFNP